MNQSMDEETVRAASRERSAIMPQVWLKVVYSLTLVALVFPLGVASMSGWVGLTLGTSLMGSFLLPLLAIVVWRIYMVWRHPTTLVRHRAGALIGVLRAVAVVEMVVGCLAALALLLQRPIIQALGGVRTDSGIEYYVLQLGAVMVGGLGLQGLVIYEWTRLIGMERFFREEAPTEIPERESPWAVGLTVVALGALLALQALLTTLLLGTSGLTPTAVAGFVVALPLTLTLVLRLVSLAGHRREVPQPVAGGLPGVVRKLALVGLAVSLLTGIVVAGLAGLGGGLLASSGISLMSFGVPLLAVLEAIRLLGYERHERHAVGGA